MTDFESLVRTIERELDINEAIDAPHIHKRRLKAERIARKVTDVIEGRAEAPVGRARISVDKRGAAEASGLPDDVLGRLRAAIIAGQQSALARARTSGHPDDVDDNLSEQLAKIVVEVRLADLSALVQTIKVDTP